MDFSWFKFDPAVWGTVGQWIAATATFTAAFIALFKDQIITKWRRPKLIVGAKLNPPDSDKIPFTFTDHSRLHDNVDCYFLRLWVYNDGNTKAEKVEVFVSKVLQQRANGEFVPMPSFLPMNLRWGHGAEGIKLFVDAIAPKIGRHCNLARIADPEKRKFIGDDHPEARDEQAVIHLETEVDPNNRCNVLPPGTYRLEIFVSASNYSAQPYTVELSLDKGGWYANQERMFTGVLGIKVSPGHDLQSMTKSVSKRTSGKLFLLGFWWPF